MKRRVLEEESLRGGGAGSAGTLRVFSNCLFECGFVFTYILEVCSIMRRKEFCWVRLQIFANIVDKEVGRV